MTHTRPSENASPKTKKLAAQLHRLVMRLIRDATPQAPNIGEMTRVFLGVRKTGNRWHHVAVRGDQDRPRKCVVIGYRLELADACGFHPRDRESVNILAVVKLNSKVPLTKRTETVHVSCLEPVTEYAA